MVPTVSVEYAEYHALLSREARRCIRLLYRSQVHGKKLGRSIAREVRREGRQVTPDFIYYYLERLKKANLILETKSRDKRKKLYTLTERGKWWARHLSLFFHDSLLKHIYSLVKACLNGVSYPWDPEDPIEINLSPTPWEYILIFLVFSMAINGLSILILPALKIEPTKTMYYSIGLELLMLLIAYDNGFEKDVGHRQPAFI